MIYFIDVDETVCNTPEDRDYAKAEPIYDNIRKFNHYYDEGHHVVYWTARGTGSGIDWRSVTERQFKTWGVKYHELKFGKPIYDVLIDDKAENPRDL